MTEHLPNRYSDEDLRQLIAERAEIRETCAEEKSAAAEKRKRALKMSDARAKQLGIDKDMLKAVEESIALEVKQKAVVAKLPPAKVELFADAMGQMSFLPPVVEGETSAQAAARQRQAEIAAVSEAEQAEGERIIDEMLH